MIAEFDECPECGTGPMVHVVRDKPLNCAVRFRCGCGMIEHIIPYGIGMDVLQEIWNDYVRQHIRDRVQSAMVDGSSTRGARWACARRRTRSARRVLRGYAPNACTVATRQGTSTPCAIWTGSTSVRSIHATIGRPVCRRTTRPWWSV